MKNIFLCNRHVLLAVAVLTLSFNSYSVELVDGAPGKVLIFPFFSTERDWDTYVNISTEVVGPSPRGNILRVRIMDGQSGSLAKSLNVYVGKWESWRAAIFRDQENQTYLRMGEGSCIVSEDLEPFEDGDLVPIPVSVGMIEIYDIGDYSVSPAGNSQTAYTCEELALRWGSSGKWTIDPESGFHARSAGLIGELYLVNVGEGLSATYQPTVLNDLGFAGTVHTSPASDFPNLADAHPLVKLEGVETVPDSGQGIDAVALAISRNRTELVNDVILAESIGAETDWVVSYPLDGYKNYKPFPVNGSISCEAFGNTAPDSQDLVVDANGDPTNTLTWGQGQTNFLELDFFPNEPHVAAFCSAVNIVAFGNDGAILVDEDSSLVTPSPSQPIPDWGNAPSVYLRWRPDPIFYPVDDRVPRPVLGFRMTVFKNGTLQGGSVLANYAALRPHQKRHSASE